MEIRVLNYFLAIAREQNMTKAADIVHVSQPALSKQMKELESELGVKLFNRQGRNITLTDAGLILRKRAGEIIDLAEIAQTEILSEASSELEGTLYIGGGESESLNFIIEVIKLMKEKYPKINLNLYTGDGYDVSEKLDKGLIDFGILLGQYDPIKYNYINLPVVDTWGILMRKDDKLAQNDSISPKLLKTIPIITPVKEFISSPLFTNWLKYSIEDLNIIGYYNLLYNASLMVDNKMGYVMCIDKLSTNPNLTFRPLSPHLDVSITLCWKKYQKLSKIGEKFLELLNEKLQN